jgi:hypothetical protein
LAIWEHCIRYEKIGRTADVELKLFRDMILGEVGDTKTYDKYKYFKSKIIKPSIAEINESSEHLIELHETKVGRQVTSLRFTIQRKVPNVAPDSEELSELTGELVKLGVPHSEVRKLVRTHDAKLVRNALAYTKARMADRKLAKLERPAAYFRHALTNRYQEQEGAVTPAPKGKPKIDIKAEYQTKRLAEAEEYFKEIDPQDQTVLIEKYNTQQMVEKSRIAKKPSKLAQAGFFRWLAAETWGEPTSDELLEFAQTLLVKNNASS